MAKPRVFVSSTHYDLKHVRAQLDQFIDSLGFEPILSEKGNIAYTPDNALDVSCYKEVNNSDLFVLTLGGRYGSEASDGSKKDGYNLYDRYESITKKEYEEALLRDIPIYVLIDKGVYSEYQTFKRNKDKKDIDYAHVDSVNIFYLISHILSRPRNNPVFPFDKFVEVESCLREQWAGFFRELLKRVSEQKQLVDLATRVHELKEINETLRLYLEAVMKGADRQEKTKLIEREERRLKALSIDPQSDLAGQMRLELRASGEFIDKVDLLAEREGVSRADLIRLAVDLYGTAQQCKNSGKLIGILELKDEVMQIQELIRI